MTGCGRYRRLLATYRELGVEERALVDAHVNACSSCAARLAAYQAQDHALSALPRLTPAARLSLPMQAGKSRPLRRWAYALALALTLLGGLGTTVRVSADALPGETLYGFKRAVESARYALTVREQARAVLDEEMSARRRLEAREMQRLCRSADVTFDGELEATDGDQWTVAGVIITVPSGVASPDGVAIGETVRVQARVTEGQFVALGVQRRLRGGDQGGPPSWAPTNNMPADGAAPGRPDAPGQGPQHRLLTPQPSHTPSATPSPTFTPAPPATPRQATASPKASPTADSGPLPTGAATSAGVPAVGATAQGQEPTETHATLAPTSSAGHSGSGHGKGNGR